MTGKPPASVSDLPPHPGWDWGLDYDTNASTGHVPAAALMTVARFSSTLFLALSAAVILSTLVLSAQTLPQGVRKGASLAGITEYTYPNGLKVLSPFLTRVSYTLGG